MNSQESTSADNSGSIHGYTMDPQLYSHQHQHPHQHPQQHPPPHVPIPYSSHPNPSTTMVYPPPPPPDSHRHQESTYHSHPSHPSYDTNTLPQRQSHSRDNQDPEMESQRDAKRQRPAPYRHPSDAEEVEAGLALAGLGLGLSPDQVRQRGYSMLAHDDSPPLGTVTVKDEKPVTVSKSAAKKAASKAGKGAKSCSECRRLKAKCDRVFPCSNCRRRGCAVVCPDGDLSCMQGKRLVLASTEQLHDRITQLETALSHAHGKTTQSIHPLLMSGFIDGGFTSNSPHAALPALTHSSTSPDGLSGSLQLGTPTASIIEARSTSHSRMAVESLLLSHDVAGAAQPEGRKDAEWVGENAAPAFIIGTAMPADNDAKQSIIDKLQRLQRVLPSRDETHKRGERFFRSCQWFTNILREPEFHMGYEPAVYEPSASNPLSPHKLAVVLMVLTLETFLDVTGDEDDPAIARYWEAAQQCFDTRFGWSASVAGIQALALATYFVTFGWRGARASNFYWLRQTTSAILQLGLHKDPHPSLPQSERDLRRRVFWEAFTIDALLSINHGQRPAIHVETVETLEPTDATEVQKVKYEYMRQVKLTALDIGCRPDSAPASSDQLLSILETAKRWEPEALPHLHCSVLSGGPMPAPSEDLTRINIMEIHLSMSSMCHYKAIMFLLRSSLRRLLIRLRSHPSDKVVLNDLDREVINRTFGACRAITQISKYMTRTHPRLSARLWSTWVQTFSAAVSMAALAIWCGPHMGPEFVGAAYQELSEACDMIRENRSARSKNVEALLPILQSLVADRYPQVVGRGDVPSIQPEKEDMLFALLGGRVDTPPSSVLMDHPPRLQSQSTSMSSMQSRHQSDHNNDNSKGRNGQDLGNSNNNNNLNPTGGNSSHGQNQNQTGPIWKSHENDSHVTDPGHGHVHGQGHGPIDPSLNNTNYPPQPPSQQQQQQQQQNLYSQASVNQHQQAQTQVQVDPYGYAYGFDFAVAGNGNNTAEPIFDPEGMSAMDLWNRLQSFYEPSATFDWQGQSLGQSQGQGQGQGHVQGQGQGQVMSLPVTMSGQVPVPTQTPDYGTGGGFIQDGMTGGVF